MVREGGLILGGEHTMLYKDDVLQICTFETYAILLAIVTLINLIKIYIQEKKILLENPGI